MVSKLRQLKQIRRQPAHQLAGAVAVIVVEGQLLHMPEQVPADIRLHQNAEGMAPVGNDIVQRRPQGEGHEHDGHDSEKGLVGTLGQQLIHTPARDIGKGQIDQGDEQRAAQVHDEQFPMGFKVGKEDLQRRFLLKFPGRHMRSLLQICISIQFNIIP